MPPFTVTPLSIPSLSWSSRIPPPPVDSPLVPQKHQKNLQQSPHPSPSRPHCNLLLNTPLCLPLFSPVGSCFHLPWQVSTCFPVPLVSSMASLTTSTVGLSARLHLHVSCRRHPNSAGGPLPLQQDNENSKKTNPSGSSPLKGVYSYILFLIILCIYIIIFENIFYSHKWKQFKITKNINIF